MAAELRTNLLYFRDNLGWLQILNAQDLIEGRHVKMPQVAEIIPTIHELGGYSRSFSAI